MPKPLVLQYCDRTTSSQQQSATYDRPSTRSKPDALCDPFYFPAISKEHSDDKCQTQSLSFRNLRDKEQMQCSPKYSLKQPSPTAFLGTTQTHNRRYHHQVTSSPCAGIYRCRDPTRKRLSTSSQFSQEYLEVAQAQDDMDLWLRATQRYGERNFFQLKCGSPRSKARPNLPTKAKVEEVPANAIPVSPIHTRRYVSTEFIKPKYSSPRTYEDKRVGTKKPKNFSRPLKVQPRAVDPSRTSKTETANTNEGIANDWVESCSVEQCSFREQVRSATSDGASSCLTPSTYPKQISLTDKIDNAHTSLVCEDGGNTDHRNKAATSPATGDKVIRLKRWQVWIIRGIFAMFVFAVNIALGLAYLGADKHPYLLAILAFMKSKDILSTVVDVLGVLKDYVCRQIWPYEEPSSKWILSLVCAYAETEEQIMKTVISLSCCQTRPHKQMICIILDGKPRNVLDKLTYLRSTQKSHYTTWHGEQGGLTINAGLLDDVPIILIEKVKNAGKKDSLILGHDLFNHPRGDMAESTQILRQEMWKTIIPSIAADRDFARFDYIFCTDADSMIHQDALKNLANALCWNSNAFAACGVLFAEFGSASLEYSLWHSFQQFQYTFGQYVRRQAESMWGRVTCLPGCITMIAVRPEMGPALSLYAKPVTDHNLFRHQVQYLGTDRRLTWCMMSQDKHARTIFVPNALSETVVPSSLSHYLSQRRRWASNAYFNDLFYLCGPQQRLVTRVFAAIDVVRLTLVFYRVFNTVWFIRGLIINFYLIKIIPTLIITKTPATWYLLVVIFKEPYLRKRFHKVILGMLINQIISPILSVIVFANVLLNFGNANWGQTGAVSQGAARQLPRQDSLQGKLKPWTPKRLAQTVRHAIKGSISTPKTTAAASDQSKSGGNHFTRSSTAVHGTPIAVTPTGGRSSVSSIESRTSAGRQSHVQPEAVEEQNSATVNIHRKQPHLPPSVQKRRARTKSYMGSGTLPNFEALKSLRT